MVDLSKYIQEGARLELEAMERMAEECSFCSSMSAQHSAQAMQIDELKRDLAAANARAEELQIAVDGAAGLLTYAAEGARRCCNKPCSEVEEMVRRGPQMRSWVLKYGKWKMGIAYPETDSAIDAAIAAKEKP